MPDQRPESRHAFLRRLGGLASLALALGVALAGCATSAPEVRLETDPAALDCTPSLRFLSDGATSRAEVLARLGEPSSVWEPERILVYAVLRGETGRFHVAWTPAAATPLRRSHDLVLVFGSDGLLERHALVVRREDWSSRP